MNLCNELIKYWSFPVQLWMESQFVSHFSNKYYFVSNIQIYAFWILISVIASHAHNIAVLFFLILILIRSFIINSYQSSLKLIFSSVDDALEFFFSLNILRNERNSENMSWSVEWKLKCAKPSVSSVSAALNYFNRVCNHQQWLSNGIFNALRWLTKHGSDEKYWTI